LRLQKSLKATFSVEFAETIVVLSYFNYICLICSLQTAVHVTGLYILPIHQIYNGVNNLITFVYMYLWEISVTCFVE